MHLLIAIALIAAYVLGESRLLSRGGAEGGGVEGTMTSRKPGLPGCPRCDGVGHVVVIGICRECNGDGHVDCYHCGHDMDCKTCSGTGNERSEEQCLCVAERKAKGTYLAYLEQTAKQCE